MALPQVVPCKVSSEAAGYVTIAAVARVHMPLEELASKILGVCGKDRERIARIFCHGSLVSGDSRFRWNPLSPTADELARLLARFPDHDPSREFAPQHCFRILLRGPRGEFGIERDVGRQRRFLRRRNFWEPALALLARQSPRCVRYSYADHADVFAADLRSRSLAKFGDLGRLLRFSSLAAQVRELPASQVTLLATRA